MQVPEKTLADVAANVLETMAFAYIATGSETALSGPTIRALVVFDGPFSGAVVLTVPEAIVPELVSNMLGEDGLDPETLEKATRDAIGELANVMCGNLVQAIAGPEPVFRLNSPRILGVDEDAAAAVPAGDTTTVDVPMENGAVRLSLVVASMTPQMTP